MLSFDYNYFYDLRVVSLGLSRYDANALNRLKLTILASALFSTSTCTKNIHRLSNKFSVAQAVKYATKMPENTVILNLAGKLKFPFCPTI